MTRGMEWPSRFTPTRPAVSDALDYDVRSDGTIRVRR